MTNTGVFSDSGRQKKRNTGLEECSISDWRRGVFDSKQCEVYRDQHLAIIPNTHTHSDMAAVSVFFFFLRGKYLTFPSWFCGSRLCLFLWLWLFCLVLNSLVYQQQIGFLDPSLTQSTLFINVQIWSSLVMMFDDQISLISVLSVSP